MSEARQRNESATTLNWLHNALPVCNEGSEPFYNFSLITNTITVKGR